MSATAPIRATAIALFVYNRPTHTRRTLEALRACDRASDLSLNVFADGPKNSVDETYVQMTRNEIRSFSWNGAINFSESSQNRGLAESIISGVTAVLSQHDSVIVLEDDIVLAPSALRYFLHALDHFKDCSGVVSISGYSHPRRMLRIPSDYPYGSYFLRRNSSWGWATWAGRWKKVNWDISRWQILRTDKYLVRELQKIGADIPQMLDAQASTSIDSWAVRFTLHHFLNGGVSLVPRYSQVDNIGADGSGTHMPRTRVFQNDLSLAEDHVTFPQFVSLDAEITKRFASIYRRRTFIVRALRRLLHMLRVA